MVRWRDLRENRRSRDPTIYGQIWGSMCLMHRNAKRSKSGQSRNQSSKMPRNYFIARRKLVIPMPPAMPCKTSLCRGSKETCRAIGRRKTEYACIVDADETMRVRLQGAVHKHHQDHITAKGMNSLNHYSPVHKFISMPQAL